MDQTTFELTYINHYEIDKEQGLPSHQILTNDIQLQNNSCYQITSAGRTTEREKYYKVNDRESTHQSHGGSKLKPKSIGPQNQTNNHKIKKNKMSICLFILTLLNITLLLLSVLAIVLSAVAYKTVPTELPAKTTTVSMQLDSNNNEEHLVEAQLTLTKMNISRALTELESTNNDIMTLQQQLNVIETNLTQVLLTLNAIHNVFHENAEQLASLQLQLYCGAGEWNRVVHLNMSDPLNQCPPSWIEKNQDRVRVCGKGTGGCVSTMFNTGGQQYRKVCGRAIGYQYGSTDAFGAISGSPTINGVYVDGLSITYGMPRQHIWTYAAAVSEVPLNAYTASNCPCASIPGTLPPSYLGDNWHCESGNPDPFNPQPPNLLSNDPLWDGMDCEGTCCSNGKSPPWFSVELPGPTSNHIEARICANDPTDTREDIFINILEIYIQ